MQSDAQSKRKFVEYLNPFSYCFLRSTCDADQKDQFLSRVEGLIMATDMSRHGEFLAKLQAAVEGAAAGDDPTQRLTSVPGTLLAELLIKCADASNVLRPVSVAKRWAVSCPHPAERRCRSLQVEASRSSPERRWMRR